IKEGDDILTCDMVTMNLNNYKANIEKGALFIKEYNIYLNAASMERVSKIRYRMNDAIFTTCNGESPSWKFGSTHVDVTLDGYAKARNMTFYINNLPVFFFPYALYPTKVKRQSGFLIPSINSSGSEGFGISIPFFWAIKDSMDATFTFDLKTKRGVGEKLEYRYFLSKQSSGILQFQRFDEQSCFRQWRNEKRESFNELDGSPNRWCVWFTHSQELSESFFGRINFMEVSDRDYLKDFGNRHESALDHIRSSGFLTKLWDHSGLTVDAHYFEDMTADDDYVTQRLPGMKYYRLWEAIRILPFYFYLSTSFVNFEAEEGEKGQKFDFSPSLSLPCKVKQFVDITPYAGFRETVYNLCKSTQNSISREAFELGLKLSSTLEGVFDVAHSNIETIKHSIKPEITYQYIASTNQSDIPIFEQSDRLNEGSIISYRLVNRLLGKKKAGDVHGKEILQFNVGGEYFVNRDADRFSDLLFELETSVSDLLTIDIDSKLDLSAAHLSGLNILFMFKNKRDDSLELEYRYAADIPKDVYEDTGWDFQENGNKGIRFRMNVNVLDKVLLNFEGDQSLFESRDLDVSCGLEYRAQCWGVKLSFGRKYVKEENRNDNRFMVTVDLFGLGESR
ncbi:MAG: LPS assembly protein LptD, partial [Thermodesulfobacteriota bacterium]|nr:LPS assembly protein LptD [Thermodesulfobacteriota bacterium]